MDYNSIHGPGISNFSSSSAHRMPTVSAAQALQSLKSSPTRCISTGLGSLDFVLQNRDPAILEAESFFGGVSRGNVTEIYGPPGVGKTALCMQLTTSALYAGEGVVWVDASHPLSGHRLSQILASYQPTQTHSTPQHPPTVSNLLSNLTHFSTPTLAHLLALLCHPTPNNPPHSTSLIIIDSFSTLISNAFPRSVDANATPRKPGAPNPSARKFPILQHLISSLQKLATTRNLAIVLTSQCVTKMRPGAGAVLVPAVNATAWEQGLGCRVELLRDWGWEDGEGNEVGGVRLVRVLKAEGVVVASNGRRLVGFGVSENGLYPIALPSHPTQAQHSAPVKRPYPTQNPNIHPSTQATPTLPQKRKLSTTDLEIPDSDAEDDEDYGWAEEDEEELPPPPPQWQGSEDALAPPVDEGEGDEELLELGIGVGDEKDGGEEDKGGREAGGEKREKLQKEVIDDSEDELAL